MYTNNTILPRQQQPGGQQQQQQQQQQQRQPEEVVSVSHRGRSSSLTKVALCLATLGLLCHIVGFSSPYWLTAEMVIPRFGLNKIHIAKQWQLIAAGVEVVGLISASVCVLLFLLSFLIAKIKVCAKELRFVLVSCSLVAGAAIISGNVLFAVNRNNVSDQLRGLVFDIGWAFAISLTGAILFVAVTIVLIIDAFFG